MGAKILLWILSGVRAIFLILDLAVYSLINLFATIFNAITSIRLFQSTVPGGEGNYIEVVARNIYIFIGIVAVFKIVFALIMMIVNPDMMNDKQKGGGKLVIRFMVTLILTIAVPFIFNLAYDFQEMVIKQNIVGKILSVGTEQDTNPGTQSVSPGAKVANALFRSFVYINDDFSDQNGGSKVSGCNAAVTSLNNIDSDDKAIAGINQFRGLANTTENNPKTNKDDFCIDYNWGISTIAGGFAAWVFLVYCLDIAIRVVKLSFLELIAPVPIVSYITSDKDGPFQKWTKTCISTYCDLFIRLIIINFVVQIIGVVTTDFGSLKVDPSISTNSAIGFLAKAAIILGILAFAKQAPDLIKDLFGGKGGGDYGFGVDKLKQRTAPIGAVGAIGAAGISNAAKTARDTYKTAQGQGNGKVASGIKAAFAGAGSSLGGIAKATTVSAGMLGKKDVQMGQIYNKAFSTAVNNRDNRDKRQIAGYTFADNMLDRGRVLMGMDPKAKNLSDTFSNVVSARQGNASQLRQAAFEYATKENMDTDRINLIASAVYDKKLDCHVVYDSKGVATPIRLNTDEERDFRKMLDASDEANVDAIKLGKVRDEMGRVKDNVTSNVKDSK